MKVLVATEETQGQRANDFCFVPEGEIVKFTFRCDGEEPDGGCGCARSMAGTKTHKATTTVKVVEAQMLHAEMEMVIREALVSGGWTADEERVKQEAAELLTLAACYPVGTVLEIRGDQFAPRVTGGRKMDALEEKLPKWVRDELTKLRNEVTGLRNQLACCLGTEPSRVSVRIRDGWHPVPNEAVRFEVDGQDGYVTCRLDHDGRGVAYLDISGYRRVEIRPVAANHVELALEQ